MTNTEMVDTIDRQPTLPEQLKQKESQFQAALPAHIPVERFMRVVMTAIQTNPELARVERQSLWNSAMKAASDGLLPDGREGAFVVYKTKVGNDYVQKAQWLPMIAGIRKKVRNSGEIATWDAQVVHAKDQFEYELGDQPFIKHKPDMSPNPGPVVAAYSVATLKSGEKSREVMTRAELEKVREASKAKSGDSPWAQWFDEMCRKTVAKRHAKVLPMSTDLDDLLRRDDELYDMRGAKEEARAHNEGRAQSLAGLTRKLDALGARDPEPKHEEPPQTAEMPPAESEPIFRGEDYGEELLPEERRAEMEKAHALHVLAREKACKGKRALTRWIGGLKADEVTIINEIGAELNEIAAHADVEAGDGS
jgi:recombination protein RecT